MTAVMAADATDAARWSATLSPLALADWCLGCAVLDERGVCVHSEGGMAELTTLVR